jgi:hypothetical protein
VDIGRFELAELPAPGSPFSALRLSGEANQDGLTLEDVLFDDSRGILRGRLIFSRRGDGSGFDGRALLSNGARQERYDLAASYDGPAARGGSGRLSLTLGGPNIQLSRIVKNPYNALLSGECRLDWETGEPLFGRSFQAALRLDSLSGRLQEREFLVAAGAALDGDAFTLEGLRIRFAGFEAALPRFRFSREDSQARTEGTIRGTPGGRELDLGFSAEARFAPIGSWRQLPRLFDALEGSLRVGNARFDTIRAEKPFDFQFSRTGGLISLSGGPSEMLRLKIKSDGDVYLGLSNPSPVRGTFTGALSSQTIEAQTQDLYVDLESLWRFMPPGQPVSLPGGFITAALRVSGPLGDPEFFGSARWVSLRLRVPGYLTGDIRPIPLLMVFEGNEAAFGPVPASVGPGRGDVSGWFRFERWIPNTFGIDIRVPLESPIPVGFGVQGIVVRGSASGNLRLSMADRVFTLGGNLTAQETEISLNTDERLVPAENTAPPGPVSVALDLTVVTGRKVEFLWPNTGIPILQAYAGLGSALRIRSDPIARRFSLDGDVQLRGGEMFYVERSFYIREGTLSFQENEVRFEPLISARADVRDRTDSGPVTISMIVDNAPLTSFTPRFEANPPLSQNEIFSLLGQTLTGAPSGEDGQIRGAFVSSGVDIFTQFLLTRRLERWIRNLLWLDMFSIRTQVIQTATLQLFGLQTPVDRIDGVGNYFDNTTVFLGKYFGPDMFTQFMLSLRYDKNEASRGGLILEPDISIELHSPLVDIRWNFVPLHPESYYINDQSFTLMWRRSF